MPQIQQVDPDTFGRNDNSETATAVRRVAEACDEADGVITLNEQACLQLKHRGLRDAFLWVDTDASGTIDGFALLHGEILDLAVHPDARGQGVGTALAQAALGAATRVEAWSHGNHPAAARIAERFGIPLERQLNIMRRPTSEPLPAAVVPPGVRIRTFLPEDEDAVLEVNAAAFAHHPEQGHLSHEDFQERVAEAWFDPEGLFLAVPADAAEQPPLLGFHWTKVHRDEDPPYGEVYVVAVNPKAAGMGLGTLLTNVGLRHLADAGVDDVILYVDGDNEAAIAVYTNQGFEVARTEVQYRGAVDALS